MHILRKSCRNLQNSTRFSEIFKEIEVTRFQGGNYIWRFNTDTFLDNVDYINTYHPSSNKFRDGDNLDNAMNNVFKGIVSD